MPTEEPKRVKKYVFTKSKARLEKSTEAVVAATREISAITVPNEVDDFNPFAKAVGDGYPTAEEVWDRVLENQNYPPAPYFRPSMIGGCKRSNYFFYMQQKAQPQRHDPKMHRVLKIGSKYHEMIQEELGQSLDIYFVPESPVWDQQLAVRGHTDGILIARDLSVKWPLEIKTISPDGYKTLTKPKPEHLWQSHIYSALHGCFNWIDVLYINKGNQSTRCFRVPFSQEVWQDIKNWLTMMHHYVDRHEVPRFQKEECKPDFCGFVEHCLKLKDKEEAMNGKAIRAQTSSNSQN
jgi:hypothetical protein